MDSPSEVVVDVGVGLANVVVPPDAGTDVVSGNSIAVVALGVGATTVGAGVVVGVTVAVTDEASVGATTAP